MADIPNWRKNFPDDVGIPTRAKPRKCQACATPIWIWNGRFWVCYNCKLYTRIHDKEQLDDTLDGCLPTGVYHKYIEE